MSATDVPLDERLRALDFAIEKSMRYHQRRRGFYETAHKAVMFGVILTGSSALAGFPVWTGAAAAVLGALDLTLGLSHKARDHEIIFRRFTDLAKNLRGTATPTEDDWRGWCAKRVEIESDEPPVYWALEADCHNEVARAWGRDKPENMARLTKPQRVLMHLWRFESMVFVCQKPPRTYSSMEWFTVP